ncbi:Dirigent protein [Quillaja saponaria]|uniref:Dirigent protein n=1 Tax=Quillaja saponaria TaxID=32244 RepID=A0AAD7QGW3_QUISA|nr:Dirigent protein [Quillaja saponaria]
MAPTSFPTPPKFMYLLLLFILTVLACEATSQKPRQTNLVFYFQDVASGPNATVIPVAGVPGKIWSFNSFGTIFVVDDPITQTPNRNSTQVGRAQGLFVASALDGSNVHVMLSIVFTTIEYSEGPDKNSPLVGRAQSLFLTTSLDGLNSHASVSCAFTNKAYNGSTLLIQGTAKQFTLAELPVVSGTGKFRYARGYAEFDTFLINSSDYVVL